MNILVCVKQVPDTTEIKIDPEKHTLIRDGVPSIVNTFDAYALELGVRLKEENPGSKVTVLSMGPPQAMEAIRTCLSVGADRGYLMSGREFGGSDTLATSYILKCGIEHIEKETGESFDLILCGKQAIDGDTAQVGPELSEHLQIPLVTYVSDIQTNEVPKSKVQKSIEEFIAKREDNDLIVKREYDEGYDRIGVNLPCLLTVVKLAQEPRRPTLLTKIWAKRAEIPVISPKDLSGIIDLNRCGLKGSPTKVKKTMTPENTINCVFAEGNDGAEKVENLLNLLHGAGVL